MINFTQTELSEIGEIIERYRDISAELVDALDNAKKIQDRVDALKTEMGSIKSEEDTLMQKLHEIYGEFDIQDIYDALNK